MNRKALAVLMPMFLLALISSVARCAENAAIITDVDGDVQIKAAGSSTWQKAKLEMSLSEGQTIKTGADGKAKLVLEDESILVIGALSTFEVTEVKTPTSGDIINSTFTLTRGMTRATVTKLQTNSTFEIKTPSALAGVRGTDFTVETSEDGEETTVTVLDGEVDFENRRGKMRRKMRLKREEMADVRGEGEPSKPRKADAARMNRIKDSMSHKLKRKVKDNIARLDERKASTLLALRKSGADNDTIEQVSAGLKSDEIQADHLKEMLRLGRHGADPEDIRAALKLLKEKKITKEQFKAFVEAAKQKRGNKAGMGDEFRKFREKHGGKMKDDKGPKEKMKEKKSGKDEGANAQKENAIREQARAAGVPDEKVELFMPAFRANQLTEGEMIIVVKALKLGADAKAMSEGVNRLIKLSDDHKPRQWFITAHAAGAPKDKLAGLVTALENGKITEEQFVNILKKMVGEKVNEKKGEQQKGDGEGRGRKRKR